MKKLVLFLNNFRNTSERKSLSAETEIIYCLSDEQASSAALDAVQQHDFLPKKSSINSLTQLLNQDITSKNIRTFVVLPSSDILFTELTIPSKQFKQVQKALPYLVEDQIASDPEECFIAIGTKSGEQVPTAIIDRNIMREWLDLFSGSGFYPEKMIADISLIETQEEQHRLDVFDDFAMLHLAKGKYYGFQLALLPVYLKKLADKKQLEKKQKIIQIHEPEIDAVDGFVEDIIGTESVLNIIIYSPSDFIHGNNSEKTSSSSADQNDLKKNIEGMLADINSQYDLDINPIFSFKSVDFLYQEMASKISARNNSANAINLLQGEFKTKRTAGAFKLDVNWKPVVSLAAVLFIVYLASLVIEITKYQSALNQVEIETQKIFKEIFPNTTNYTSMKSRVSVLLKDGGSGQGVEFISIFYHFSEAIHAINSLNAAALTPTQIQYEENGELKVDIIANSFESLNALKEKAEQADLQLDIASTNTEKTGIKGRLRIRLKE